MNLNPLSKLQEALHASDDLDGPREPNAPWWSALATTPSLRSRRRQQEAEARRNGRRERRRKKAEWRADRKRASSLAMLTVRDEEEARGLKPGELQQAMIDAGRLEGYAHTPSQILKAVDESEASA